MNVVIHKALRDMIDNLTAAGLSLDTAIRAADGTERDELIEERDHLDRIIDRLQQKADRLTD